MADNKLADLVIDEDKIAPKEISDEALDDCNAVSKNLDFLIGGSSNDGAADGKSLSSDMKTKIAVDLLAGELCNRPDLVSEISPMHDPGIGLLAYACDSSSGKIGDSALQVSLADYNEIYCSSAKKAITQQVDSLVASVEGYKTNLLSQIDNESYDQGSSTSNSTAADDRNVGMQLEEISSLATNARTLVNSEMYYDAAKALDKASKLFYELTA